MPPWCGRQRLPTEVTLASHGDRRLSEATPTAAITATGTGTLTATAGVPLCPVTLATFSDGHPYTSQGVLEDSASVDWGDGSGLQSGTVDGSTVSGSHTYNAPGSYTVRVVISKDGVAWAVATANVDVAPAAPIPPVGDPNRPTCARRQTSRESSSFLRQ